jgi:hypothetical protein
MNPLDRCRLLILSDLGVLAVIGWAYAEWNQRLRTNVNGGAIALETPARRNWHPPVIEVGNQRRAATTVIISFQVFSTCSQLRFSY